MLSRLNVVFHHAYTRNFPKYFLLLLIIAIFQTFSRPKTKVPSVGQVANPYVCCVLAWSVEWVGLVQVLLNDGQFLWLLGKRRLKHLILNVFLFYISWTWFAVLILTILLFYFFLLYAFNCFV